MNYGLGCKVSKIDIRDYKIDSKKAGVIAFPPSFCLHNLPKVKNQMQVNSCCAHAASSILEYYAGSKVNLSTNFLYGMERSVCGEEDQGMYLVDACKIAKEYGDMTELDCPGNYEVPIASNRAESCAQNKEKLNTAKLFCIESYYGCNNTNDIKYALMHYGPVLACIYWYGKYSLDKNAIITFGSGKDITTEGGVSNDGGYHAVMIYGWNESGWLIQNSWGSNFGNRGRFILPFKYEIAEARVMIDKANDNEIKALVKTNNNKNFVSKIYYKIANFILNKIKEVKSHV